MRAAKLAGMIAGAAAAVSVFSFRAYADAIELTPSQTLALYGQSITGEYYAGNNATPEQITFEYVGTTLDWLSPEQYADGMRIPFSRMYGEGTGSGSLVSWQTGAPALVYRYWMPVDQWSEWHGDDGRANLTLDTSITISSITHLRQKVWWTAKIQPDSDVTNPVQWGNPGNSWATITAGVLGTIRCNAMTDNAFNAWQRSYTLGMLEAWDHSAVLPTYDLLPMYGIQLAAPTTAPYDTVFDYTGASFHINAVNAYDTGYYTPLGYSVLLLIQCPELEGEFIGPTMPVTTEPTTTTRPDYTAETAITYTTAVTIDNFADDIQEIIRNQRWQIYNQEVQIRNQQVMNNTLRNILARLDSIYVQMVNQNPELEINNRVKIERALQDYSQPIIPESARDGMTFWGAVAQRLGDLSGVASLGALGLSVGIACWILFRGRQS